MNNRGQFSIIAALFVAVILIATVITTYSTIRNSPVQDQPPIQSAIDETNFAIKQILGFTVGYYGSVLQVTGNSSYAKSLALNYLQTGLVNIANMHPEWGTSFNVSSSDIYTNWFTNSSYSTGNLGVNYNLTGLGIYGITYQSLSKLSVQITNTTNDQASLEITKDENEPSINLGKQNFKFYRYENSSSTWNLVSPSTEPVAFANSTYQIEIPDGIDHYSYVIQVEDPRGIIVVASSFSRYTCNLSWNSTLYSTVPEATLAVELLQNGTMRWLGENLTTQTKPIPPIPVKAIHVTQTISGANQEVPFQIEDWASDYKIPLGLTNNASIFNNRNMLVFLINPNVSKVTVWWNGSDTATQTSLAFTNRYFVGDNTATRKLTNGIVTLQFSSGNDFLLNSTVGTSVSNAKFMRINGQDSTYGSGQPAYAITGGIVRDVVHQEAEWSGGVTNCPNIYGHVVITLPANVTYYTYQLRVIFAKSQQNRTISELRPLRTVTYSDSQPQTENGTASGYPIVSTASNSTGVPFYNSSVSTWAHHWSQFTSGTKGSGIMFTDTSNLNLYYFDAKTSGKTGALKVSNPSGGERKIELAPISLTTVYNFTSALDIVWNGAVVTFDGTQPIYKEVSGKGTGLWITVESPPTITVTTES